MSSKRMGMFVIAFLLASIVSVNVVYGAGNCGTYKTFSSEILTAADLNNSLVQAATTNSTFACLDDYSASVAEMRTTTDPYPSGAASLATTGAGELERLRYVILQIHGRDYWYQDPTPLLPPGNIQLGVPSSRSALLYFYHASSGFFTSFQAGNASASTTYTWPTAGPSVDGYALTSTTAGVMSWAAISTTAPVFAKSNTTSDFSTTATSLVDVTGATVTFTTGAFPVFCSFNSAIYHSVNPGYGRFSVDIDGVNQAGAGGLSPVSAPTGSALDVPGHFTYQSAALTAASHTIKVQVLTVTAGTLTIDGDAFNYRWECHEIR